MDREEIKFKTDTKEYNEHLMRDLLLNNVLRINDRILRTEIAKEKGKDDIHLEILKSANLSSEKNHEQKRDLKPKFFWIVMIMYIAVILGSIATIIIIPIFCKEWYAILPSVLASIASIITALIKIPSIIAEYLFPKEEDDLLVKLSNNVFRHDEKLKMRDKIKNKQDK